MASDIAGGLTRAGWNVVSGAAYGIAAAAHAGALAAAGFYPGALVLTGVTVVVLACGVDVAYPRAHAGLLREVTSCGLVVSEAPPGRPPARAAFLARNRIIAALAAGVVVVEAGRRSGAMSTVRHAGLLDRAVMAVPVPVISAASAGCHQLIRERAAVCVTSAADILPHLCL